LFLFDLLQDFACIDLHLFEDVGLVGFGLDLDGLVDHLAELTISFVQLAIALHEGVVARSVGTILILQLEDTALEIRYFVCELLLVFCELFVGT
jgi:hypothetical protein